MDPLLWHWIRSFSDSTASDETTVRPAKSPRRPRGAVPDRSLIRSCREPGARMSSRAPAGSISPWAMYNAQSASMSRIESRSVVAVTPIGPMPLMSPASRPALCWSSTSAPTRVRSWCAWTVAIASRPRLPVAAPLAASRSPQPVIVLSARPTSRVRPGRIRAKMSSARASGPSSTRTLSCSMARTIWRAAASGGRRR
jgi:hypothetical protein